MCFSSDLKKSFSCLISVQQPGPPADRAAVALLVYIALFPVLLLFGLLLPPDWQRFGFQWQALGLTAFIAISVLFSDSTIRDRYCSWFVSSRAWLFVLLALLYLAVMTFRYGVEPQRVSLASGYLFAVLSPVLLWISFSGVRLLHRFVLSAFLLLVLLVENTFLVVYRINETSPNAALMMRGDLPRLFINIRDGNAWAIGASVTAFSLTLLLVQASPVALKSMCRSRLFFVTLFSWFLVFFNGWITQGRGLFVAIFCGIVVCFLVEKTRFFSFALLPVFAGFLLSFGFYKAVSLLACGFAGCPESMIDRFLSDASLVRHGRLDIWSAWIRSGLSHSFFWGHGLGVKPDSLSIYPVNTPHNLFVQIFSDSGFFGVLMSALLFLSFVHVLRRSAFVVGGLGIYSLVASLLYLSVAGVLFWAVGVWLVFLIPIALQKNEESLMDSSSRFGVPWFLVSGLSLVGFVALVVLLAEKISF